MGNGTVAETNVATCDRFIPVSKRDLLDALVATPDMARAGTGDRFRLLCRLLGAAFHYEHFERLERLRDDYYYFNPDLEVAHPFDPASLEKAHSELVAILTDALKEANFVEVPHADIARAHDDRQLLRVEVDAPMDDYREVVVFRRGHHMKTVETRQWFGLRKRAVETAIYDHVVLMVMVKPQADIKSAQQRRRLAKNRLKPGTILIKYFRDIAFCDLRMLFPEVRVVLSVFDKLLLGVPALVGGIPIILNLYTSLSLLFVVVGFYLGVRGTLEADEIKTALAALSGLAALGGFIMRQWVKYQRQSLKYQKEITDNVYYRNVNNNAGIFDYIVGVAEEQECKEVFLAYYFLHMAADRPTKELLEQQIEAWLQATFGIEVKFTVSDVLEKLNRLGILQRDGDRLAVPDLLEAIDQLQRKWTDFFREGKSADSTNVNLPMRVA